MFGKHIGKRSAAGLYCTSCGTTLSRYGTQFIHSCEYQGEYDSCPICGEKRDKDSGITGSVALELFGKKEIERGSVRSVSSFTWTTGRMKKFILEEANPSWKIKDEYEKKHTIQEFRKMYADFCFIEFQMANPDNSWS